MTLKEFSTLYNAWNRKKHPTVPEHAVPTKKFSDKSANDLTNAIVSYFDMKGIQAWRQSSEGRYLPRSTTTNVIGQKITQKGKFIPRSKAIKGVGDITVTLPPIGRRLEIEVKHGQDRQSEAQKEFQKNLEAMGALYMITKTWDDFHYQITKLL